MLLKLKFYFVVLLILVCGLEASVCRFPARLIAWADAQISPESNLYQAAKLGSQEAASRLVALSIDADESHWLRLLADEGYAEAHYHLALRAERPSLKSFHLNQAATSNYAPALFELGIIDSSPTSKMSYLTRAAEQDYFPAKKALYQWHWFHEDYQKGLPWLEIVANADHQAALTLGLYFWREGTYEDAKAWLEKANTLGNPEARVYLKLIADYWQKGPHDLPLNSASESCAIRLQFVATSLDSIKQANNYYKEFGRDERFEKLPICLLPPVWVEHEEFSCDSRPVNNYRVSCNLSHLESVFSPDDFSHLTIFADQGKANVVNGVMFLDLADKYSVFVHELAHFVGFIDEYPLSPEFAGYFCNGVQQFPNLLIVPEGGTLEDADLSYWQSVSNDISLSRADTCNNHPAQAYKFSSKLTFMEFHDTDYIPPFYLEIWQQRLSDRANLRSAAINIAQSLEEQGNSPAALKWWNAWDNWRGN